MTAWEERAGECLRRLNGVSAPLMAEIGVGHCNMARTLLGLHPRLRLLMVDSFLPGEQCSEPYKATGDNFAKRTLNDAARDLEKAEALAALYADRARLMHMDSAEAARLTDDGSLDLVFIDADHSYEGVKRDIALWLPKVRRGGWLGGHDYRNNEASFDFSGVERAVIELERNFGMKIEGGANYTWFVRL